MTKELIIIALAIWIIYLYYQQKKQNHLTNFTGSDTPEDIQEIKKVNQIMAGFCRNEIGGQDINEIRTKLNGRKLIEILEENEDYETEVDTLTRKKKELEAELLSLNNTYKNRVSEKENIIKRLEGEKAELKKKVNTKAKQLDEEQCENNKLTEKIEQLEEKIEELKNYLPKSKEFILKSMDHLENKVQEFKNWLNENEERKGELVEWDKVFAHFENRVKETKEQIDKPYDVIEMDIIGNFILPYDLKKEDKYSEIMEKWTIEAGLFTKEEWQKKEEEESK